MWKLKSDKGLAKFLSEGGVGIKALAVALLGILLMLPGVFGGDKNDSVSVSEQTLEEKVAEVCSSVEGVGRSRVIITYGDEDAVYAVAVLCDGADSVYVRRSLTDMISSLFGIGANRISILKISG